MDRLTLITAPTTAILASSTVSFGTKWSQKASGSSERKGRCVPA